MAIKDEVLQHITQHSGEAYFETILSDVYGVNCHDDYTANNGLKHILNQLDSEVKITTIQVNDGDRFVSLVD